MHILFSASISKIPSWDPTFTYTQPHTRNTQAQSRFFYKESGLSSHHAQDPQGGLRLFLKSYCHVGVPPVTVRKTDWTKWPLRCFHICVSLETSRAFPFMEECAQTACLVYDCSSMHSTLSSFWVNYSLAFILVLYEEYLFWVQDLSDVSKF